MTSVPFDDIAATLRSTVIGFYERSGEPLVGPAGANTLETNSGFVERRGAPLLTMLDRWGGMPSVADRRVADLGCGFGALTAFFAAHGAVVTGIDPNVQRLAVGRSVAERHALNASFEAGRMEALPLPNAEFDVVLANNSFCYIVSPVARRAALAEALRILRPGGVLLMRNPNRLHPIDQFTRVPLLHLLPPSTAVAVARRLGHDRSWVRLRSPMGARRELQAAGYTRVVSVGFMDGSRPDWLRTVARYQHVLAFRPSPGQA